MFRKIAAAATVAAALCVPAAAYAASAYTTTTVYVRSGPDTAYPPVGLLSPNRSVQVLGCLDGWTWCDVAYAGNRGWVAGAYLQAYNAGYRTNFVAVAPRLGIPHLTFHFGSYWDRHYRGRHFYNSRHRWERWDHGNRHWRNDRNRDRRDHRRNDRRNDRRDRNHNNHR